jgi:hypothetical protein
MDFGESFTGLEGSWGADYSLRATRATVAVLRLLECSTVPIPYAGVSLFVDAGRCAVIASTRP